MNLKNALILITLGLTTAATARAQSDQVLRVYDVRDLRVYSDQSSYLMISPHLIMNERGTTIELATAVEPIETAAATDVLMEIAGVSGLAASRLQDGIYIVTGEESGHQQLVTALESYRAVNGERFIVQLEARLVVGADVPAPGQLAGPPDGESVFRSHQTVSARAASVVKATTTEQYVSGWVPVVSTQAVGYQIQFGTAEDGFTGTLVVGSDNAADSANVQLAGIIIRSDIHTTPVKLSGDELPLSTVRRQERGIQSSVAIPLTQRCVIASVSGFDPDTTILITATVTPAPRN